MKTPLKDSNEATQMRVLLGELKSRQEDMVRLLETFVRCESPSQDKAAVDRFGAVVAAEWRKRSSQVRVLKQRTVGHHLRVEIPARGKSGRRRQILVLGHLDTVYPLGAIDKMRFRVREGKAFGPGTFDMKGGLIMALFAVDALRAACITPSTKVVFLWTSDEEIGSHTSRQIIEREAGRSDAVLVLEPSLGPQGRLKTARKGVGTAEIIVHGRAAHAGIDPGRGVNAVHELALQIERLIKLNNFRSGVTVQATVIAGGTASNVVPDTARAQVDIRFTRQGDGRRVVAKLRGLRPVLRRARIEVRGGINRPPLERSAGVQKLFAHAKSLMHAVGLPLDEASTGGGSDGNFTAALGVPTLDGLGAIGDGAHSAHEHVVIRSLPERAALLAGLLSTL